MASDNISAEQAAKFINSICTAEYDFSQVLEAIERMKPSKLKTAFKKVFRQAGSKMRNPVRAQVRSQYPGNVADPRNPRRKHGVLRGKQYGSLYKDVRMSVYKNGQGVNVNMYTPRRNPGRQNVLRWLSDGTAERFSRPANYAMLKDRISRKDYGAHGGQSRGSLLGAHFWEVVYSHTQEAEQYVAANFAKILVQAYEKQISVER